MTTTSQSYKELGMPSFKEVFELLDENFKSRDIPYYLLGSAAISLKLLKDNIKVSKGSLCLFF